jgi:hypothetical protein
VPECQGVNCIRPAVAILYLGHGDLLLVIGQSLPLLNQVTQRTTSTPVDSTQITSARRTWVWVLVS